MQTKNHGYTQKWFKYRDQCCDLVGKAIAYFAGILYGHQFKSYLLHSLCTFLLMTEKEEQRVTQAFGLLSLLWKAQMMLLTLAWPSAGNYSHLGNESVDGQSLSLFHSRP